MVVRPGDQADRHVGEPHRKVVEQGQVAYPVLGPGRARAATQPSVAGAAATSSQWRTIASGCSRVTARSSSAAESKWRRAWSDDVKSGGAMATTARTDCGDSAAIRNPTSGPTE